MCGIAGFVETTGRYQPEEMSAIAEAMAHSLPVVAFDVGGISEWLEGGETGLLVPRRDAPDGGHGQRPLAAAAVAHPPPPTRGRCCWRGTEAMW